MSRFYTVGDLAKQLDAPIWEVRRIVDALGVDVPRAGQYRLVPASLLPRIRERLAASRERRNALAAL